MNASLVCDLLETLVCIGAPTGKEQARAAYVAHWLAQSGLGRPQCDEAGNVWLPLGPGDGQAMVLDAHLDTVFDDLTLTLRKEGNTWHAPGVFDNTVHVAMLMAWAKMRQETGRPWPATILSFTTGEEGLGNLAGMRALCAKWQGRISQVVAMDLHSDRYLRQAVGSLRWEVTFTTTGGHSWGDFGRTSAIHSACQWVTQLADIAPWENSKHSYNVGLQHGGQGVNVIAPQATLLLDVRSIEGPTLVKIKDRIEEHAVAFAQATDDLHVTLKLIGDRPAGQTAQDHPLVKAVEQVHRDMGQPLRSMAGSTNANWPMHLGIGAICTGFAQGQGVHTRSESLDIASIPAGLEKLDRLFNRLTN